MPKPATHSWEQQTLERFLRRAGYRVPVEPVNLLVRWWVLSFAQPGINRFWRVWNPLMAYPLSLLYRLCGGRQRPLLARLIVFCVCGFVFHDIVTWVKDGHLGLRWTISFAIWAVIAYASFATRMDERQESWPWPANVLVNVAIVAGGLFAGRALWAL